MRQILALAVIGVATFFAYRIHENRVKTASAEAAQIAAQSAAAKARAEARAEARAQAEALRARATPPPPPMPELKAVAVSRIVEPLYQQLFSDLNAKAPVDLVPMLEITNERILDKMPHVEPGKEDVYAACTSLMKSMIAVAEVRTQTLEALLEASAKASGSLESRTSSSTSASFFTQTVVKRWIAERQRRKPPVDQLLATLRQKEREWNRRTREDAPVDTYEIPSLAPVFVTVDPSAVTHSPLQRGAYDQRRVMYPWRSSYYERYGYRGY